MGFSGYQNVSQNHNVTEKYFTLQDVCLGVFFCDNYDRIYLCKIVS